MKRIFSNRHMPVSTMCLLAAMAPAALLAGVPTRESHVMPAFRAAPASAGARMQFSGTSGDTVALSSAEVLSEKTAVYPNYDFTDTSETRYITDGAKLRLAPEYDAQTAGVIEASESVLLTGTSSETYWRCEYEGEEVFIDCRSLVKESAEAFETCSFSCWTLKDANLKYAPSLSAEPAAAAERGSELLVTGANDAGYWRVEHEGQTMYIHRDYLTDDPAMVFDDTDAAMYLTAEACFLDYPTYDGDILGTGAVGDKLLLRGINSEGYARVTFNGGDAYVNTDYLSASRPAEPEAEETESSSAGQAESAAQTESSASDNSGASDTSSSGSVSFDAQDYQLEIMCAVVRQEAGPSYESALAVMSSAVNRANSSRWRYMGATPFEQLTAPGQYSYSIDSHWQKYMGFNVPDATIQAVRDGLNGITSHGYTSFRSYYTAGSVCIGGNYYF